MGKILGASMVAFLLIAGGCGDDGYVIPDAGLAVDQCLADADVEIVLASRSDAGPDAAVLDPLDDAYVCSLTPECFQLSLDNDIAGMETCINVCLDGMPTGGLSKGCRDCYAFEARNCAGTNCLIPCLGDDHALCEACFADFCQARLTACIGY